MQSGDHYELLRLMYKINDYPSDKLFHDREALEVFTDIFNSAACMELSPPQVAKELEKLRKYGSLPRLGRNWQGPVYGR